MVKKPVASAAVVDEYHDHETHAAKRVEGEQAAAALGTSLATGPAERLVDKVYGVAADDNDGKHDEYGGEGGVGGQERDEESVGGMVCDVVEGGNVNPARLDVQADLGEVLQV